jgi:hypothetical protein
MKKAFMKFTSADCDTPCALVESNGRQYKSHKWESKIKVFKTPQQGMVKVVYDLICAEGQL